MTNMMAYHGTDLNVANKIRSEGFKFKTSDEHWLGNGIYLYSDYSLAKWWTTKPTKKFGSEINEPAILYCNIKLKDEKVLNLLKLEDYVQFSDIFEREFYPMYKKQHPIKLPTWKQLRCSYCDYLKEAYDLEAIIGNFYIQDQPYLPEKHNNIFDEFLIQYTEIQICVFKKDIIKTIKIEKL